MRTRQNSPVVKSQRSNETDVIDFGAHFYPEDVDEADRAGSRQDQHVGVRRIHDAGTQAAEMRASRVDAMVVSNSNYLGHGDADRTATANDALFEHVSASEEFYGLAGIPTGAGGEAAAAEFERCIEMGFHGAGLDETRVELTDEEMEPVLEVADRTGAPILVHIPELPTVDYRLNATYGREFALQKSITRAVHDGIYDRYPNATLVWHHLGGNIASMLGRTHLQTDAGRWPDQDDMKSYEEFKADLEANVYVDTSGFFGYSAPVRVALEEFPSTQLLFGSDYPWEPRDPEELDGLVNTVLESGTAADAERILGQNALDVMVNV